MKFTEKERDLIAVWLKLVNDGERDPNRIDLLAASKLGIAPSTVRTRRSRLKAKHEQALRFLSEYRSFQQQLCQKTGGLFNPLARGRTNQKRGGNK